MTTQTVHDTILSILATIAPEADLFELDPHEDLREALDIDSFDYLNFIIALHDHLGIEIPEGDYTQLGTLDEIERYLASHGV